MEKTENYILQKDIDFSILDNNIMEIAVFHDIHYQQNQFTSTGFFYLNSYRKWASHCTT